VQLEAGELVMPGTCTRAINVTPGDTIRAQFDGLGDVTVGFVDDTSDRQVLASAGSGAGR
jgi:2-keto-4-pentenoate hydratase